MRTVVFLGNFGATNIGDEALLESLLHLFRSAHATEDVRLHVISSEPIDTEHRYGAKYHCTASKPFPGGLRSLPGLGKSIKRLLELRPTCSQIVFGGGGLFTDRPRMYAVLYWWLQFHFVRIVLKKPIHIIGQSFGPLDRPFARLLTRDVLKRATTVVVRDEASSALVVELHPEAQVHVLPDLAFAYPHVTKQVQEQKETKETVPKEPALKIALSFRPWHDTHRWIDETVVALKTLAKDQPLEIGLFPMQMEREEDISLLEGCKCRLSEEPNIHVELHQAASFEKLSERLSSYTFAMGQRLHFLICALRSHIPIIAINYSSKVSSLLSDSGAQILTDPESEDILGAMTRVRTSHSHYQQELIAFTQKREKDVELIRTYLS